MISEFWTWLVHGNGVQKCSEKEGEARQAKQIFESSLRNVQRAEKAAIVQRHVINIAAEDLKSSVHQTIDKMRAGERAINAAVSAVQLLDARKEK